MTVLEILAVVYLGFGILLGLSHLIRWSCTGGLRVMQKDLDVLLDFGPRQVGVCIAVLAVVYLLGMALFWPVLEGLK
jgi:hypothetical protein